MRKAALHNLGCKVNAYETEAMQQLLEKAGYEIVNFHEVADVYVINTCSVTNIADRKSRQMLHRAKAKNPQAVVVAAGCYVQAVGEQLLEDAAVDLIIGNNKKGELPELLERYFAEQNKHSEAVIEIAKTKEYEALHIERIAEHTRAFIKVQDGCNQFCTYCIIPYTRGRVRSRELADTVQEAKRLAKAGYQELVLTGIHLSSYGVDFEEGKKETLLSLIEALHEIPEIRRIRLGSLEPRIVTEEFASKLASLPKLCPHFHLSLQSGCNATLRRMNRRYTAEEYLETCERLRRVYSNPAITTDVIVGFPQESEEEFEETYAFLKKVHFYEMHVFKYSRRQGTRAAEMPNQVEESVKSRRSDRLLELEREMSLAYRQSFAGQEKSILLEDETEIDGVRYRVGFTEEYVRAAVPWQPEQKNTCVRGRLSRMLNEETWFLEENSKDETKKI
ncbi:MAG: tRNA (N(6)-L-threonylcarbamoyladenosine(37)-C(2))-methylthiotransferase MtaB [bacterium]|nr:tRNA (N(6)-L-threonylcarbamoyladenosine(37)-C(2))-methylthiotransferase MtaB [bacterium]